VSVRVSHDADRLLDIRKSVDERRPLPRPIFGFGTMVGLERLD
jgi:hypothetical protein